MSGNVGPCGLCRNVRELQVSHMLPAALYDLARDPSRTNPNPVLVTAGRAFTTSRQVAAPFLCHVCEQRFSDRGERYVLGQCARPNGEFKVRELLENIAPLGETPQGRVYDVAELLGSHTDEYLYFAASVFWRASAREWSPFSLGDMYDEEFRLYLLGQADFPQNGRLVVHVWSDRTIGSDSTIGFTTIAPCTSRVDGERRHKFCIPGVTFILFLGRLVPERHDGGSLNSAHGKFMGLSPFLNDSLFQGFSDVVRRSRPSASLVRSTGKRR